MSDESDEPKKTSDAPTESEAEPSASREAAEEATAEASEADEPAAEAGATSEPKKKAKKKKKRKAGEAEAAEVAEAAPVGAAKTPDAEAMLAALPGAGTPDGEVLRDAWAAFEVGDYQKARQLATKIASSSDEAVKKSAADVITRMSVDPVQLAFLAACAIAILTIAWVYIPH